MAENTLCVFKALIALRGCGAQSEEPFKGCSEGASEYPFVQGSRKDAEHVASSCSGVPGLSQFSLVLHLVPRPSLPSLGGQEGICSFSSLHLLSHRFGSVEANPTGPAGAEAALPGRSCRQPHVLGEAGSNLVAGVGDPAGSAA